MLKAVIFDLDDTLISEKKYIESGFHYISSLIGEKYEKDAKQLFQLLMELFNKSPGNVFNRLLDELGIAYSNSDITDLVNHYRNHSPLIQYFDDVLPCLEDLRKKELKLGIITDGYANAQRQKLKAVKADNYFDEIIVTDELGRKYWKPHPKAFEMMKEKMKVNFGEMIYVGDNPEKDFYIGSIYPIKTIRIYREGFYNDRRYLNDIRENISIHSLCELSFS